MMSPRAKKLILIAAVGLAAVIVATNLQDGFSLEKLVAQEQTLRQFQQQHPLLSYVVAFGSYVAITGLSIPGATALTLLTSWIFGFVRGVILVSFASTAGATFAFLLSRYLFREPLQNRFGQQLSVFNEALSKNGASYLFALRLIPLVPFFVINAVMGLTPLRASTFWWVSQLGMLPATLVYVYAGSSVPTLAELAEQDVSGILSIELLFAFALLGLFPFLARYVHSKIYPTEFETRNNG